MKKNAFSEKYKISTERPTKLATSRVTVVNFASSLHLFLEENFHGAVDIDSAELMKNPGYITLCPEFMAYFFKLMLVYIRGRDILYVKMECDRDNKLILRIDCPTFSELEADEVCDIVRAAKGTQFLPYESPSGFVLKKSIKMNLIYSLYSISNSIIRDEFYRIFFAGYDDENNLNFFKDLKRK